MRALFLLIALVVLGLAGTAQADDIGAREPRRVEMPRRVLRAVARRPKVTVLIAPAAVPVERPTLRASFVERITRSVSSEESF